MTSIGLLLGVSAAKLGTMDMSITRLLSIHIPALLPPTSTELDVPHNVQVAAVVGIGLVYQGTAHRHTAEVLLAEIGMINSAVSSSVYISRSRGTKVRMIVKL